TPPLPEITPPLLNRLDPPTNPPESVIIPLLFRVPPLVVSAIPLARFTAAPSGPPTSTSRPLVKFNVPAVQLNRAGLAVISRLPKESVPPDRFTPVPAGAAAPLSQIFKLPALVVPPEMLSVPVPTAAELDPPTKMPPVTL